MLLGNPAQTIANRMNKAEEIKRALHQIIFLSLSLFNFYIDALWQMAKDDGVTSVVSITVLVNEVLAFAENSRDLLRFLSVCYRWVMGYGMVWATEKCTIVQGGLANEVLYLSEKKITSTSI